jgi:hypothetical protein
MSLTKRTLTPYCHENRTWEEGWSGEDWNNYLDEALAKGDAPYVGQTARTIAERIAENGKRVRRTIAVFHVDGATLDEAEQWLIDTVKQALDQEIEDPLGRSNPGNQMANRRNQVKSLIGKALPMCK